MDFTGFKKLFCDFIFQVVKLLSLDKNNYFVVKKEEIERLADLFENLNKVMNDSSPSVSNITLNMKCTAKYEDAW